MCKPDGERLVATFDRIDGVVDRNVYVRGGDGRLSPGPACPDKQRDCKPVPVGHSICAGRQYIAITAGGGPIAAVAVSMTPEADTLSGSNAVYVFALPQ